ncbi:MAG: flagellar hook-length control protein FliK [Desulfobacteraceae bacterium]|nr:MAG: flagellar hook-length control protein FliK [Desulfobacteraceae bacterium]
MITRISLLESLLSRESSGKPAKERHDFRQGEVLRGEVVRKFDKGEVLLLSRGKAFRAFTNQSVKEGARYEFRVSVAAGRDSPLVLEPLPRKAPVLQTAKAMEKIITVLTELPKVLSPENAGPKTASILKSIVNAVPDFLYRAPATDPVAWLSRLVADGGLFWEGKTARFLKQGIPGNWRLRLGSDLKGMLVELRSALNSEKHDSPEIESTSRKVEEAIELIQKIQFDNRDLLRTEGCWFIFLPGRPEEGFQGAELYARREMKEDELRFSMLLEFTSFGCVEVNASIVQSSVSVRIGVSDEEKAEFVRMHLDLLEQAFREKGFMPARVTCEISGSSSCDEEIRNAFAESGDSVDLVI